MGEEDSGTLAEQLAAEVGPDPEHDVLMAEVRRLMDEHLDPRELEALQRYYLGDESLDTIGRTLPRPVSREMVRQVRNAALR